MRLGDLVYLRWEDSRGCPGGWERASDARDSACSEIESVGWVLSVGERTVQIAPHVSTIGGELNCVQGHMTVPLSCVLKVRVIEKASSAGGRASAPGRRPLRS
jgi:hypothetical protein